MPFFEIQQKLFGNIAWCMYNRESYAQATKFCTRVLTMFDDAPQGKLPNDVQMRAKYLYLRGQCHLADTTSSGHLKSARQDCEAGKALKSKLTAKFDKLLKKINTAEVKQKQKKAKFAKGLAFGVKKSTPTNSAASKSGKKKAKPTKASKTKTVEKKVKKNKKSSASPVATSATPTESSAAADKSATSKPSPKPRKDKKSKKKKRKSKKKSKSGGLPGWVVPVVAAGAIATGLAMYFGSSDSNKSSVSRARTR